MLKQCGYGLQNGKRTYPAFAREFGKRRGIPIGVELEVGSAQTRWRSRIVDISNDYYDDYGKYYNHWVNHHCDARNFMFSTHRDGSVKAPDMELTFWPASAHHWRKLYPKLDTMFQKMFEDGLSSGSGVYAGMHLHISRKNARIEALFAILYALSVKHDWWLGISGRTEPEFNRWCKCPDQYLVDEAVTYFQVQNYALRHGSAANIEGGSRNTLELRVFSGTLDVVTFLARIEFMELLYQAADEVSQNWGTRREKNWFDPEMIANKINAKRSPNLAHAITIRNQPLYNLGL